MYHKTYVILILTAALLISWIISMIYPKVGDKMLVSICRAAL
jgi:hypothetical protein